MEYPSYYAILPAEVRYDPKLSDKAKLLYGEITSLCSKYGECWAGNEYFAQLYHCSPRTISRLISLLKKQGYITVKIIYKTGSKEIDKRTIILNGTPIDKTDVRYRQNYQEGIDIFGNYPIDKNIQENNTSNINNTSINITPIVPKKTRRIISSNDAELQFERFWEIYPRHEKKALVKHWFEKNKPDAKLYETIISKLDEFKKTDAWKKENGKYIPQPTTWLNQKRWEDEMTVETDDEKQLSREEENKKILAELEMENHEIRSD